MNARYSKGKLIFFAFDLTADRELEFAYLFLHGAIDTSKPLGEVGEKLREMLGALRQSVIEKNEREIEASHYDICIICAQEIHKSSNNHQADKSGQFLVHKICPSFREPRKE